MLNEGSQTRKGAYYIISFMRDSRKLKSICNLKKKQKSGCLGMRRGGKERLQRFTRKLSEVMNMFNIFIELMVSQKFI